MRKLSFLLLLATAAAPAIAASDDNRGSRHDRSASSEQSETRPQRAASSESRSQRASERASERRGPENREQRASAAQRPERGQASQQQAAGPVRQYIQEQRQQRVRPAAAAAAPGGDANAGTVRRTQRDSASGQAQTNWRERERRVRTIPDTTPQATQQGSRDRGAFRDRDRNRRDYRDGNYTRWSNNHWRGDRRYDWRRYRDRNRSVFRIGFYSDPFGWNYRRWSVGSFLNAGFYRSSYWLNDPWHYRLPPAYGPYRWVRYWNDALLVNIYTGQVEDVIHGFFW